MLDLIQKWSRTSAQGLHYLDNQAEGEVYVLLHGISSGAQSWIKQFMALDNCRLIAWDAPGYGQSQPLATSTPNAEDYAAALQHLLQELAITKPIHLIGHSLGALIASGYAYHHAHALQRLVLVNPAQGYGFASAEEQQRVYQMRPQLLERLGQEGMARERGPRLLAQQTPFNLEVVAAVSQGLTQTGMQHASYLLAYDSIERYLAHISVPTQLIYGEQDVITPPSGMFTLQQKFPQLQLTPIPEAGHLAYLDQVDYFNQCVFQA